MAKYLKSYTFLFSIALAVIILDQWTKSLVRANLPFGAVWSPWDWLMPYARIVHWNNTGAAFGMLQGYAIVFTILAVLVAGAIIYYFPRVSPADWPLRIAMGLQLGGAMGNLIDRLQHSGQVTDFISVGNFAVFNVADASITIGVVVLLIGIWTKDWIQKKKQPVPEAVEIDPVIKPENDRNG